MENLDFGKALEALKQGKYVARNGWNGKGMYIFLIGTNALSVEGNWTYTNGKNDNYPLRPFIAMKTVNDEVVPWVTSQSDILVEDWVIVE